VTDGHAGQPPPAATGSVGALSPLWSGATLRIAESGERPLAIARHRIRCGAHRIAADCERLLETLGRPERALWRDAAGEALVASHHALAIETRWEQSTTPPADQLAALTDAVREPQRRIIDAMGTLLGLVPTSFQEELLLEDARDVRETAIALTGTDAIPATASRTGLPRDETTAAGPLRSPADTDLKLPRLLVADDDPDSRRTLARLLERLGYDVVTAEHGLAALEMVQWQPFDLILTDIAMPQLDGLALLRRLKSADATRDIPVIMVSGLADLASVVECIENGAEDHITKPYEVVLLHARIRASLERKRMRDLELAYLRRVGQLTAAAEAVERDAYQPGTLDAMGSDNDELGRLARVFDRMVSGIRQHADRLQRRLEHLRQEMRQARARPASAQPAANSDSPFRVGQTIADRYEILGELGRGGMGMVYQARDAQLGEEVALKVVRRDLVGHNASLVERLKSEIRLARRISHRNVVRAHDLGEWQGVFFLTMEFVKGINLSDLLDTQGSLSIESTLAIGTQLADALAVAHEQQVIHRDIKPANLLINDEGILKVMDFGLARLAEHSTGLTQAGYVVGTPGYMAPEQHLGGAADARSDLFSAGVVLYECLAGRSPFDASSPMAVVDRVLECRPAPIRQSIPQVPPALAAVIGRLLQREPRDRVGSARELAEQLAAMGQTHRELAPA